MLDLRPYQASAIEAITEADREGVRRPLVVHPTGTGKTVTFSHLIAQRAGTGRALVLVHRDELANQTVDKINLVAPELTTGVVKAERNEVDRDVVVASVQTIHRDNRLAALLAAGPVETVVVDEAHHAPAPTWTKVLTGLGSYSSYGPLTVGFTATPERDGKSLGVWEKVVSYMSIREAIYAGYLCGVTGQTVQTSMDLGNVRKTRGDYADGSLGDELENSGAIEEIADAYLTYAKDRKGVAFTPTVATAEHLAAALVARGIKAEMVSGQTPTEERRAILGRLKSGATQVVTNCAVLCLDDQTEILTDQGWVGIDKMTYTHRVANWDDGRVHFVEPQEIVVRDRQPGEDMYVLETKRRSIRVTGRHRMLYRERRGDKWSKAPVDDLVGRALELPVSGRAEPSFIDPGSEPSLGRRDRAVSANAY